MSDMEKSAGTPVMPMSRALLLYFACLLGFMLVLMLRAGVDWLSSWVPILAYLGRGDLPQSHRVAFADRMASDVQHHRERRALEVPTDVAVAFFLPGAVYPTGRGQALVAITSKPARA